MRITASQVTEARDAITDRIQQVTGCTEDQLLSLLDDLYELARIDAVTDVIADLEDDGETNSVELLQANYATQLKEPARLAHPHP